MTLKEALDIADENEDLWVIQRTPKCRRVWAHRRDETRMIGPSGVAYKIMRGGHIPIDVMLDTTAYLIRVKSGRWEEA